MRRKSLRLRQPASKDERVPNDFAVFLRIYHSGGADAARANVERWRQEHLVDTTQYALMLSFLERQAGDLKSSVNVLRQALSQGASRLH